MNSKTKGRLILLAIVLFFALPALIAKTVLTNHWYQSGVTNKGVLVEPRITLSSLGIAQQADDKLWKIGYLIPEQCDALCQRHVHMLMQSHIALGKEQGRVAPVLLIAEHSDIGAVQSVELEKVSVNSAFIDAIDHSEVVILDPLGQLVMYYPKADESQLVVQSKSMLADLRKLLKLSRVG